MNILGFNIPMYGLLITIGALIGLFIVSRLSPINGIERQDAVFAALYGAIGLAVGGKLLYLITVLPDLIKYRSVIFQSFENVKSIITGGFVFYGGLIGAIVGVIIYAKIYKIKLFPLLDLFAVAVPFVHMMGRLGCFCAGCCYGKESAACGVMFNNSPVAPHGVKLIPTQLISAAGNLLLFVILVFLFKKKPKSGICIALYAVMYSVARFAIEFLRGDEVRGIWFGLSTSQWISVAVAVCGTALIVFLNKNYNKENNYFK